VTSDKHSEGRLDCQIAGRLKSENAPTFCFYAQIPSKASPRMTQLRRSF